MSDDAFKTAENRGYKKGYAAGLRRKQKNISAEAVERQRTAFWQRAFLAALPACIAAEGWKRGDKPIANVSDRARLAADFADAALAQHWKRRP